VKAVYVLPEIMVVICVPNEVEAAVMAV